VTTIPSFLLFLWGNGNENVSDWIESLHGRTDSSGDPQGCHRDFSISAPAAPTTDLG
jgi:hypothetical protein